jgi:hypothetical protein
MKLASSIRYGGQLVEAAECDYNSYKHLGLLCPECKDPVYLRAEGKRLQHGKEVSIGACFCHFPGKDPTLIAQCENRVSKYTPKELQRMAAQAKGQRLKLLQRWFWSVFGSHPKIDDLEGNIKLVDSIIENGQLPESLPGYIVKLFQNNQELLTIFAQDCFDDFRTYDWGDSTPSRYEVLPEVESFFESEDVDAIHVSADTHNKKWAEFAKTGYTKLDVLLQKMIVKEVVFWLCSKSASPVLEGLCKFGIAAAYGKPIAEGTSIRRRSVMTGLKSVLPSEKKLKAGFYVCQSIAADIASIPWTEEFDRLQKEESAKLATVK